MEKPENDENDSDFVIFAETPEEEKQVIRSMTGNKKIWNYFLDLLDSKRFQDSVGNIKKFSLNSKGLPKDPRRFLKTVGRLCRHFGLDEIMWSSPLEAYILRGELPKENLSTSCVVFDREEMGENEYPHGYYEDEFDFGDDGPMREPVELEPWSYSHPVIIRVSPYASQREIIDYIKKSYNHHIRPIQERYQDEDVSIGKVRKKKEKIQTRNKFIYEHKHLPRKEIMQLVTDTFDEVLDYGHIGKIISLEIKKRENK